MASIIQIVELKVLLLVIALVSSSNVIVFASLATNENGQELEALLKWKDSLDKSSSAILSSWELSPNSATSPCDRWVGITCDKFCSIIHINLTSRKLEGEIPPELGFLTSLETLNLSHNQLSDYIPTTFDEMSSLTTVDVSYNMLAAPLPSNKAFRSASAKHLNITKACVATQPL
ncbi:hypothetical protein CRYUN_Cryun18bG0022300 [Craigia yunnanensis]